MVEAIIALSLPLLAIAVVLWKMVLSERDRPQKRPPPPRPPEWEPAEQVHVGRQKQ